jgi:EAL domain-containing protein (putative c-di-GMP-specific phosphodiesterase class I)
VLEQTGLIREVGRWALRKALDDHLRWRAAGLNAPRIAVNVSALQLRHRNFVPDVRAIIDGDPNAATALELEITESVIMADIEQTIEYLRNLRAMGIRIAIDDFGTGFSSLSYLSRLPLDALKIDRSFVTDMTRGAEGMSLVAAIVSLAHSLKLNVVAEGVETQEQFALLQGMKCDEMQGYLFSRPLPCEVIEVRYLASPDTKARM